MWSLVRLIETARRSVEIGFRTASAFEKKEFAIMKTAIIGLGSIGSRVAANVTAGNQIVIVSQRDLAKADEFARKLGGRAEAVPIDEAVKMADVIILAIWFDAIKEFVGAHRKDLARKIIVDPSNPIAPDGKGSFKKRAPPTNHPVPSLLACSRTESGS
jgi:predicted dinucleotide-binding enzyme